MEIKDAISLYNFFGQIGILGSVVISLIVTIISIYLLHGVIEKIMTNEKLIKRTVFVVAFIILGGLLIISGISNYNKSDLDRANRIKEYMVSIKRNWSGFRELSKNVYLSKDEVPLNNTDSEDAINKRAELIAKIVSQYPDAFLLTGIQNNDSLDKKGIEIIDTTFSKIISKHYEMLIPFFKEKIKKYMLDNKKSEMCYDSVRYQIDDRCQDYVIDKIINAHTDLFVPINFPDDPTGFRPYGIKMNKDSIKKPSN